MLIKKEYWPAVAIVVIVAVLIFRPWKYFISQGESEAGGDNGSSSGTGSGNTTVPGLTPPAPVPAGLRLDLFLTRGSTGPEVSELQRRLIRDGADPGPVDGIFGPRTEAALVAKRGVTAITLSGYDIAAAPYTW